MKPAAYVSPEPRPAWQNPVSLPAFTVQRAKRYMRNGLDLSATAIALDVERRDLDVSLWRYLGTGALS